jgi:hypothetical protein
MIVGDLVVLREQGAFETAGITHQTIQPYSTEKQMLNQVLG